MKNNIIITLLAVIVLFSACKKDDGFVPEVVGLERVPVPLILKNGGSISIDVSNLSGFEGTYTVGLYFPTDVPPVKFDVVIRKNNNNADVRVVQAGVTSFPSNLTITAAQIAAIFGAPIVLGDNYDIGVDVFAQNGKKYEAFPVVGAGYAAGVNGQANASTTIRYSAVCQYNSNMFQGNFVVLQDDWDDFAVGSIVVITRIDDTHFSFHNPLMINSLPYIVTVNPVTFALNIPQQSIGTATAYGYTLPRVETTTGAPNVVNPCNGEISLNLRYTFTQGTASGYVLRLRKQ